MDHVDHLTRRFTKRRIEETVGDITLFVPDAGADAK